ncbi:MAG: ATP-binding protein [Parcubacteria group bacterium]|nr:ATP-binding protein [Parcubacteria group bacterium]
MTNNTETILTEGTVSIKDIIAPSALEVNANFIKIGGKIARTFFVISYPKFLTTNWLSPIINLDKILDVSLFFHPVDTAIVLKNLRKKAAQVESQLMAREEKGQTRDPVLEAAIANIEELRDRLSQATEKLFKFGLYFTLWGESLEELEKTENEIRTMLEGRLIMTKTATYQQEEGFNSALPTNDDQLQITMPMNTDTISSAFPFVSFDLTSNKGILYGINRHNNSLIIFDRFSLPNYNSLIFATSGAGKSYTTKLEVLRAMMLGSDVMILDPENEYEYLSQTVGGSFFRISLTSKHHINPFDLPRPRSDENPADVLRSNIINLVGLLRIMLGGLSPEEDGLIDRAITETYAARNITVESDFSNAEPPLMSDLQTVLESLEGGKNLATRLEKYTRGSYAGFLNQPSNVDIGNRLVVFSIRDMEDELRPIAMYIILHFIWNEIRREIKKRILIVDEAWVLMKHEDGASFLFGIAKRGRKYYLGLTIITQDVADLMNSPYGKPIVTNSSMQLLLKQSPATIETVVKTFNLTDEEKFLLLESNVGEGIFFAGLKHAAIKVIASYAEDQIITSDPSQLLAIQKAKEQLVQAEEKVI